MRSIFGFGGLVAMAAGLGLGLAGCHGGVVRPTPLTAAVDRGNVDDVRRLLRDGASPDEADRSGRTPLMLAARTDRVEIIELLVRAGADVNGPDDRSTRWPPLIHAIHKGRFAAALALLDAGADPNGSDPAGATPLMFAAAYGNLPLVRSLLARGADPRTATKDGVTALWAAAGGGGLFDLTDGPAIGTCYPKVVDAILEKAPELRVPTGFSTRVIHAFAAPDCDALLRKLEVGAS